MAVKGPDVRTSLVWVPHFVPVWCLLTVAAEFATAVDGALLMLDLLVHVVTLVALVVHHPLSCRWCRALEAQRSAGAYRRRVGLWVWHHRRWVYVPVGWGVLLMGWLFVAWHPGPGLVVSLATLAIFGGIAALRYADTVHTAFRYWCLDCPQQDP